jgi:hypothetical protein
VSRGKPCTICQHTARPAIDALLTTGQKLKAVAAQFPNLSIHSLTRHRKNCLGLFATGEAATTDADSLQEKCKLWLERADSLFVASGAALDLRGQRDAIAAAFRALEFRFKHEERLAEQQLRELPDDPSQFSEEEALRMVAYLDGAVAKASKTSYATPDVRWLNVKVVLGKRPELWDTVVAMAQKGGA